MAKLRATWRLLERAQLKAFTLPLTQSQTHTERTLSFNTHNELARDDKVDQFVCWGASDGWAEHSRLSAAGRQYETHTYTNTDALGDRRDEGCEGGEASTQR